MMELEKKGWYCPRCDELIRSKRYPGGLISCECYEIAGANICLSDTKKNEVVGEKNWYKIIKEIQKSWKEVYIQKE